MKRSSPRKTPKNKNDGVTPFREKLWDLFAETARGMDGADVVMALKQAGEEIWAAGIDGAYTGMSEETQEGVEAGNAFDVTWLTVVCIKLREIQQGKKPTVRIKATR